MLLTITYKGQNTSELGYLLHKNPNRPQMFELGHGNAFVLYPELSYERTTIALLLDINPINLVRGKVNSTEGGLFDYVNDRPYVSSSLLSTAISKVFGTAMTGRADEHQKLSDSPLDLEASVTMLPCRGDINLINKVFEPLGYEVNYETFFSDENFPSWGNSKYVNLIIKGNVRLRDLLKHLYVLIPVFDKQKHYWVGEDEVEKLLRHGEEWLSNHPEKENITNRYLKHLRPLVNMAFTRLISDDHQLYKENHENKVNLNTQRLANIVTVLKNSRVKSVIDIGCGEGSLLSLLLKEKQFERLAGVDVSHQALENAAKRLKYEQSSDSIRERFTLFQSSITYKDSRFKGYDAACVIEVIEHLDLPRLSAFERVLFEHTKPPIIILTTPNHEYNVKYENIDESELRHADHRFEWTREEFHQWALKTAEKNGYKVQFSEIGISDDALGAPTQMGVFTLCE